MDMSWKQPSPPASPNEHEIAPETKETKSKRRKKKSPSTLRRDKERFLRWSEERNTAREDSNVEDREDVTPDIEHPLSENEELATESSTDSEEDVPAALNNSETSDLEDVEPPALDKAGEQTSPSSDTTTTPSDDPTTSPKPSSTTNPSDDPTTNPKPPSTTNATDDPSVTICCCSYYL